MDIHQTCKLTFANEMTSAEKYFDMGKKLDSENCISQNTIGKFGLLFISESCF